MCKRLGGRLAPDGRRHVDLARSLEWEKSRMSHQVSRTVKRGLVARRECPEDGRGAFVVITPEGREAIAGAAPRHAERVVEHLDKGCG